MTQSYGRFAFARTRDCPLCGTAMVGRGTDAVVDRDSFECPACHTVVAYSRDGSVRAAAKRA
jgi:predicted RNA-binding Zn-ribbon protein involved in translation (DUF1610 family)